MGEITKDTVNSMEGYINKIQGVLSSRVVVENGEITEIHVLADSTRNAKQIARDVQSVIMAQFGIDINHKIVSVAQIDTGESLQGEQRLVFSSYSFINNGLTSEARVILTRGDEVFEGYAEGPNTTSNKYKIIANATLDSISKLIPKNHLFLLEDVDIFNIAKNRIIVVGVTHVTNNQEELLTGSCLIKKDEGEAVVKATLDAVNRRVMSITSL
ncbi:hypothetical protein TthWC1_1443 [Thermoanaerobacter thermohydrosulfuricus WC1]|uniref:Uncharacterized protein n=1 Tax=Thermoanaerobacter thermohydrosulfuricus WC1 TaxID=1198630 RepID=M8DG79_THETY|nr:hypothetical protein [Thermoanaerobacter thermohydrosulfuricus]EMT39052.1 hypothetical protein TthWC1_1443 [Thermoanaerobacter thermohydrosulfuricus WC1]